jgi:hypothetical protein
MDVLFKSLTQHASIALVVLAALWVLLAATLGLVAVRQRRLEKRWRTLLTDTRGDSLERLLYDHLRGRMQTDEHLSQVDARLDALDTLMRGAIQHVGLVRYDAFPDVAGGQSFSLAAYDENGDGAILTSIVGRNSCRVYCKPLISGRSERDLSQEEQRAIRAARETGVRTILSP